MTEVLCVILIELRIPKKLILIKMYMHQMCSRILIDNIYLTHF
jgi:hypothetical protein